MRQTNTPNQGSVTEWSQRAAPALAESRPSELCQSGTAHACEHQRKQQGWGVGMQAQGHPVQHLRSFQAGPSARSGLAGHPVQCAKCQSVLAGWPYSPVCKVADCSGWPSSPVCKVAKRHSLRRLGAWGTWRSPRPCGPAVQNCAARGVGAWHEQSGAGAVRGSERGGFELHGGTWCMSTCKQGGRLRSTRPDPVHCCTLLLLLLLPPPSPLLPPLLRPPLLHLPLPTAPTQAGAVQGSPPAHPSPTREVQVELLKARARGQVGDGSGEERGVARAVGLLVEVEVHLGRTRGLNGQPQRVWASWVELVRRAHRQACRQVGRRAGTRASKHAGRCAGRRVGRQAGRQADVQADAEPLTNSRPSGPIQSTRPSSVYTSEACVCVCVCE